MTRQIIWELHILPMFRLVDRDHMMALSAGQRLDLFNYDQVVKRASPEPGHETEMPIFQRWIRGHMPPANAGGPWPDEWIALFDRWVSGGFQRLAAVTADYGAGLNGGMVALVASGQKPGIDDQVWFERLSLSESPREYRLVREAIGEQDPDNPVEFTVRENFAATSGVQVVIVHDTNGPHEVTIE